MRHWGYAAMALCKRFCCCLRLWLCSIHYTLYWKLFRNAAGDHMISTGCAKCCLGQMLHFYCCALSPRPCIFVSPKCPKYNMSPKHPTYEYVAQTSSDLSPNHVSLKHLCTIHLFNFLKLFYGVTVCNVWGIEAMLPWLYANVFVAALDSDYAVSTIHYTESCLEMQLVITW